MGKLREEHIDEIDAGLAIIARLSVRGSWCAFDLARLPDLSGGDGPGLVSSVRQWLDADAAPSGIGIAARSNMLADSARAALDAAGLPARSLAKTRQSDETIGVVTTHRMKGLEFRCVAVIGAGDQQVPAPAAITPIDEDETIHYQETRRERCLLFVACTRAREQLTISWHANPSPFLTSVK